MRTLIVLSLNMSFLLVIASRSSSFGWNVVSSRSLFGNKHRHLLLHQITALSLNCCPSSRNPQCVLSCLHRPVVFHRNFGNGLHRVKATNIDLSDEDESMQQPKSKKHTFQPGDAIQVEVISFGPLGASVEVIGIGHDGELLPPNKEPYGVGLIFQKEIAYFRQGRDNVDVVLGEILNAYVQKVREEDGKLDIALRSYGGKAKSEEIGATILERLQRSPGGILNIGEKSSPKDISTEFPGVSKGTFKKALGGLYKKSLVQPGPHSIELMKKD